MFTVDNGSDNEEDFKLIRSTVNNFIRGREEFSIDYPIRYLLFCLELQNWNRKVLSFDECKVMAANYGIEEGQLSHLLQFLHLRIGVIRYFDKDGVRHIVICKPEVLFNKVTDLIVKTFSSGAPLRDTERDDFKEKGIITASVLNTVIRKGDILPEVFLQLLVHLRIAAKFSKQDGEDEFFLPCVLNHVSECTESLPTTVMPLAVKFQCKHCPKGLFGVLITHLMTPDLSEGATSNTTTFTLMQDKIFKDQVSFEVVSSGAQDEMTLKLYPSHLEITFFPEDVDPEYRDTTVAEVCNSVRQIVETSVSRSLHDLHYNESRVKATLCFSCDHENCSDLHPIEKRTKGFTIFCDKRKCIPAKGKYWYGVEPETVCESNDRPSTRKGMPSEAARRCSDELPPIRRKQESPPLCVREVIPYLKELDTAELYYLGVELGLNTRELERIPTEQLPLQLCMRWLREDDKVHQTSGTPTWSSLATAMRKIGASGVASSIERDILEIH